MRVGTHVTHARAHARTQSHARAQRLHTSPTIHSGPWTPVRAFFARAPAHVIRRLRAQAPHAGAHAITRFSDLAAKNCVRASRRLRERGRVRDSGTSRRVAGSSRPRRPRPAQTQAGRQAGRRTGRYSDRRAVVEADRQAARGGGADGPPAPRLLALAGEARLTCTDTGRQAGFRGEARLALL